ncbi:MAG: hypothetical protein UY17_C0017G0003 [Candidatus Beckwithbacteria bacterium GW2011_GWC2_47_9]|uniref:Uncharacterized protein n=1 Tax=Candidatus Beckwithbacteria bacterium GW2011_GWC2_47_9 TaxID=1618373 RepID=A0A0G1U070_9BACT|nr:MAG: hypothetical protein UY17_C0017G0003 [Candidatus Beckwithbacteria bacterium GW2011_GWC2_47_9]
MSKSLLVTRSNHDEATNYLYYWSSLVIKDAKKKLFSVYDLAGKKANKKNFDSYLKSKKPTILFLNGHGNATTITGQNLEPLLEVGKKSAVAETIIYARSCDAGITLGKRLIKDRAKAFIGYNRKFILGYTPQKLTRPLSDSLAKLFLEPSNLVVTTLIKSKTAQAAQDRSKQAMWKNFRRMTANRASSQMRYTARWLWSNYKSQVLYGDAKAAV